MVLLGSNDEMLKTGDKAPEFSLMATDGKKYSLADFSDKKTVLIVFICNHCPYVIPKIKELKRIAEDFSEVAVVCINSNDSAQYEEDSFEKMQEYMQEWKAGFVYLHDETQEVARAYGAVCTPDPFLFDNGLKLIFHSRIDNTHGEEEGKHEMYEAVKEFLEKGSISLPEKPSMGCSIKWKG